MRKEVILVRLSDHEYFNDSGVYWDRGITRSWDRLVEYDRDLVRVNFIGIDDPRVTRVITLSQKGFNPFNYPIDAIYEITRPTFLERKLLRKEETWRRVE